MMFGSNATLATRVEWKNEKKRFVKTQTDHPRVVQLANCSRAYYYEFITSTRVKSENTVCHIAKRVLYVHRRTHAAQTRQEIFQRHIKMNVDILL